MRPDGGVVVAAAAVVVAAAAAAAGGDVAEADAAEVGDVVVAGVDDVEIVADVDGDAGGGFVVVAGDDGEYGRA